MKWKTIIFWLCLIGFFVALIGSSVWYEMERLDRRSCIGSHSEEDTCSGIMPLDVNSGAMMPYTYPCSQNVCDKWYCEHRNTKHDPWYGVPCR